MHSKHFRLIVDAILAIIVFMFFTGCEPGIQNLPGLEFLPRIVADNEGYGIVFSNGNMVEAKVTDADLYFARVGVPGESNPKDRPPRRIVNTDYIDGLGDIAWSGREFGIIWSDWTPEWPDDPEVNGYFVRLNRLGRMIGSPTIITEGPDARFGMPRIAHSPVGWGVVWDDDGIYFLPLSPDGSIIGEPNLVVDINSHAAIAWGKDGYGVVSINSFWGTPTGGGVFFQLVNEAGNKVGETLLLNNPYDPQCWGTMPQIAYGEDTDGNATFGIVWEGRDADTEGASDIFLTQVSSNGTVINDDPTRLIASKGTYGLTRPDIAWVETPFGNAWAISFLRDPNNETGKRVVYYVIVWPPSADYPDGWRSVGPVMVDESYFGDLTAPMLDTQPSRIGLTWVDSEELGEDSWIEFRDIPVDYPPGLKNAPGLPEGFAHIAAADGGFGITYISGWVFETANVSFAFVEAGDAHPELRLPRPVAATERLEGSSDIAWSGTHFGVVWNEYTDKYHAGEIWGYFTLLDDFGRSISPILPLNTADCEQGAAEPRIAHSSNGGWGVVWDWQGINFISINDNGTDVGTCRKIAPEINSHLESATIAWGKDSYGVVYNNTLWGTQTGGWVWFMLLDESGDFLIDQVLYDSPMGFAGENQQIAYGKRPTGDGIFGVVWYAPQHYSPGVEESCIFFQQLTSKGELEFDEPFKLIEWENKFGLRNPDIAWIDIGDGGAWVVTYEACSYDEYGDKMLEIYYTVIQPPLPGDTEIITLVEPTIVERTYDVDLQQYFAAPLPNVATGFDTIGLVWSHFDSSTVDEWIEFRSIPLILSSP